MWGLLWEQKKLLTAKGAKEDPQSAHRFRGLLRGLCGFFFAIFAVKVSPRD